MDSSDCNGTRTYNHLVCKRTLNHLVKLAIIECEFTLRNVREMIRTYSQWTIVLGPLFFVIYINDLVEVISSSTKLFADDTLLFSIAMILMNL